MVVTQSCVMPMFDQINLWGIVAIEFSNGTIVPRKYVELTKATVS